MPKNYFVNEGNRIGGQEPQALGAEQVKISALSAVIKGQVIDIVEDWKVAPAEVDSIKVVGIASNTADIGGPVVVETEGFVKLDADGVINVGDEVVSAGGGKVKAKGESVGTVVGIAFCSTTDGIVYVKLR